MDFAHLSLFFFPFKIIANIMKDREFGIWTVREALDVWKPKLQGCAQLIGLVSDLGFGTLQDNE